MPSPVQTVEAPRIADPVQTTEAARIIGVSAETIREWERAGVLPAIKTYRGVRLFERAICQAMAAQRAATRQERATSAAAERVPA